MFPGSCESQVLSDNDWNKDFLRIENKNQNGKIPETIAIQYNIYPS
jgi:hypothetical protein